MSYFIGIEDLVANALIELVEQTGTRTVLLSQLGRYCDVIMQTLKAGDIDVTLLFTKAATERFYHDCSDIFTIKELENDTQISLNDNISTAYLRKRFRINMSLNLLRAFVSEDALKTIMEN